MKARYPNKDEIKEQAYDDCRKYGTPSPSVDHRNHYKRIEVLMGKEKEDDDRRNAQ